MIMEKESVECIQWSKIFPLLFKLPAMNYMHNENDKAYILYYVKSRSTMNYAQCNPLPKDSEVKVYLLLTRLIEYRRPHGQLIISISLKHHGKEAEPRGKKGIVKCWKPVYEVDLSWESIPIGKVKLSKDKHDIFVEIVADHLRYSYVPKSSMNHE